MTKFKKNQPKITVAIRTYNHALFIRRAITSVSNQTYSNLEIIVLNDASTDNTHAIIKKLTHKDKRIIYINNLVNRGLVAADNSILERASGTYIARLDGDDYWTNTHKLEMQCSFLQKNPEYVLVGNFVQNVDIYGNHLNYQTYHTDDIFIKKALLATNQLAASGVLFKTKLAKKYGYAEQYRYIDDLELWLKLGKYGKFANLPYFWTAHRMTGNNMGEINRRKQIMEVLHVIGNHKNEYPGYIRARIKLYLEYAAFSLPEPAINIIRKGKQQLRTLR